LTETEVIETNTGKSIGERLAAGGILMDAVFSPDATRVVTAASKDATVEIRRSDPLAPKGLLRLWDRQSAQKIAELELPSEPRDVEYSPNGEQLVVRSALGEIDVLDPSTLKKRTTWLLSWPDPLLQQPLVNGRICISPDSRWVLTYGEHADPYYRIRGLVINVFDINSGELRYEPLRGQNFVFDVEFSRDGEWLASAAIDKTARVWDFERGAPASSPLQHPDWVGAAHFSADGNRLLTACRDGMARLWDWRTGELVLPPLVHDGEVLDAQFTPDGRWIITSSVDRAVRVWDINDGRLITPPMKYAGLPRSIAVTPDSNYVLFTGGWGRTVDRVDLDQLTTSSGRPLEALVEWHELLACQRVYEGRGLVNLSPSEWLARWQELRGRSRDAADPNPADTGMADQVSE
jgi:WD40 repeat protein